MSNEQTLRLPQDVGPAGSGHSRGVPDLSRLKETVAVYAEQHRQALLSNRFAERAEACWGLVACGAQALDWVDAAIRSENDDLASDAAGVLTWIGMPKHWEQKLEDLAATLPDGERRDSLYQLLPESAEEDSPLADSLAQELFDGKLSLFTAKIAFIDKPMDDVFHAGLVANPVVDEWFNGKLLKTRWVKQLSGSLKYLLSYLEPDASQSNKSLLVETANGWTATFESGWGTFSSQARRLQGRAIVTGYSPHIRRGGKIIHYGNCMFGLDDYSGSDETKRSLQVSYQSRWDMHESGAALPFEDLERYQRQKVRECFDLDMLNRYCLALGIRRNNPAFYGPRALLLISDPYNNGTACKQWHSAEWYAENYGEEEKTDARLLDANVLEPRENCFDVLVRLAHQGNPAAEYSLASIYDNGATFPLEQSERCVDWYRRAAAQGHTHAQHILGNMLAEGQRLPADPAAAEAWLVRVAEQGDASAQYGLGERYFLGKGLTKDCERGVYWLRRSAEQGNFYGQWHLAIAYATGQGVPKDDVLAFKWYHKAARQIGPYSTITNTMHHITRYGRAWSSRCLPQRQATKLIDQQYANVRFRLAHCYAYGKGVKRNEKKAFEWMSKAAKGGNTDAQRHLASWYENGENVALDNIQACEWLHKLAMQGHADGQQRLGYHYLKALGVPLDYVLAAMLFYLGAKGGNEAAKKNQSFVHTKMAPAQIKEAEDLASNWKIGTPLPETSNTGHLGWYRALAESGELKAYNVLGYHYLHGIGVPQEHVLAAMCYGIAAKYNNAIAVNALASIKPKLSADQIKELDELLSTYKFCTPLPTSTRTGTESKV